MRDSAIISYLDKYAEPESQVAALWPSFQPLFSEAVAVPLRGEPLKEVESLLSSLSHIPTPRANKRLVVAVVNGTPGDPPILLEHNSVLLSRIRNRSISFREGFFTEVFSPQLDVIWIDRFQQEPFHPKQGVGLARKIGGDFILSLQRKGQIQSPWIWTTDADAQLPDDYFHVDQVPPKTAAFHYRYRHLSQDFSGADALALYEIHLRFYFQGLLFAGSPFAYPTIGSCLAIQSEAYAQVRGFPDRTAGEDFHLLNKLRKVGPIFYKDGGPVSLKGRFSQRVPFGTGQATTTIFQDLADKKPFRLYDPSLFILLRTLLMECISFLETPPFHPDVFFTKLKNLFPNADAVFNALGFLDILKGAAKRNSFPNRVRHFHTGFDALKTLRFIHLVQQTQEERPLWQEAVGKAPFLKGLQRSDDAYSVLEELQKREDSLLGANVWSSGPF